MTFQDAYDEIADGSLNAEAEYKKWRQNFAAIAPNVENFVHEKLFEISSADVAAALARGTHALGDVDNDRQLPEVEKTRMPKTAIQDLFHKCVETRGVPSWEEFQSFLREPAQKELLLAPWWRDIKVKVKQYPPDRVKDAIQLRIGRMYYSNMREIDFLARMREGPKVSLKYHVFADVRLRTDFWIGNNNISVFLSNSSWRGQGISQKTKAEELLNDSKKPFKFHEIEFPNLRERGKLYRVSDAAIEKLANGLI